MTLWHRLTRRRTHLRLHRHQEGTYCPLCGRPFQPTPETLRRWAEALRELADRR